MSVESKDIRAELRLPLTIAADADPDETVLKLLRRARQDATVAVWVVNRLLIADVQVEDPWGLSIDLDSWKRRDPNDGESR